MMSNHDNESYVRSHLYKCGTCLTYDFGKCLCSDDDCEYKDTKVAEDTYCPDDSAFYVPCRLAELMIENQKSTVEEV